MFVLQKNSISNIGTQYLIAAGTKGNVKTYLSRQLKTTNDVSEQRMVELLKINSDGEIIKSLKSNDEIIQKLKDIQDKKMTTDENIFLRSILEEFLKYHLCTPENCLVCRNCGQTIKKDNNEVLGNISVKNVVMNELLEIEKDWACDECRLEFVVFSWTNGNDKKLFSKITSNREIKEKTYNDLIKEYLNVQIIVSISPLYEDVNVTKYIHDNIDQNKDVNDKYFRETAIELFIAFYSSTKRVEVNSQRICEKCGCIYINADKDSIGFTSQDINEMEKKIGNDIGWICRKCGTQPSLTLLTLCKPSTNYKYHIDYNIQNQKDVNSKQEMQNMIPCLELCTDKITTPALVEKLGKIDSITINANKLASSLPKKHVVNTIIEMFLNAILEGPKYSYKICSICYLILDENDKELGSFWVNNSELLEEKLKTNYKCPFHKIENIIYWNMSGWNTLAKIKDSKVHIFENTDIICLTETHLMVNTNINLPNFLEHRINVNMPAEKSPKGRGSGGLMLLIKKNIKFKQNTLMFSNKGIFVKIKLEDECFIIGVLYWRPEPRKENLEDWLNELNNFINVHNTKDIKFIIGGDFNARIGDKDKGIKLENETSLKRLRNSSDTMNNKRGRLLLELMKKHNFILCNGRTKSDNPGKYTSHTVNGDSVVDYIWVSSNCTNIVNDLTVLDIESSSFQYHRGLYLDISKTKPR